MKKVMLVVGTRPEAIKMAPIFLEIASRPAEFDAKLCATAQHRQMLDQVLQVFNITPAFDLDAMRPAQSLNQLLPDLVRGLGELLERERPDRVLVQGDTTTAFAGAMSAFQLQIPVGHVEAGLRTHDLSAPFPEEGNRKLISAIADLHFAPTQHAAENLRREGIAEPSVVVTGNSVIDALFWVLANRKIDPTAILPSVPAKAPWILVTGHRRESFGAGFRALCTALTELAGRFKNHQFVYPVHLNPLVRDTVFNMLDGLDNIHLVDPVDYVTFVHLMQRAEFIISDSGGIQEEATALGKPVLVTRAVTERPEAIEAGVCTLVGTDPERIFAKASELIKRNNVFAQPAITRRIYGDGRAASRIADALLETASDTPSFDRMEHMNQVVPTKG
ncbi:MAG: non-hydrolyzing UDP-N-acetylglucosamine 2-epimerase [Litorimonas sp.]